MFYCLVFIFIFLVIFELSKRRDFVHLHRLTGSVWTYIPVIGHAYKFCFMNKEGLFNLFNEASKLASNTKTGATSIWLGNQFILGIGDPNHAVEVIKSGIDKNFLWHFMSPLTGNGSVFAPGEISHRRRKILAPTFTARNISSFVKIFEANANVLIEKFDSEFRNPNFSPWKNVCLFALDSVCESVFGTKIEAMNNPSLPFTKAFHDFFENITDRITKPWLHFDAIYKWFPAYKRQNQAKKEMYDFVDNIIQSKLSFKKSNAVDNNLLDSDPSNFTPFLKLILQSSEESGKRYNLEELREETLVLLLAATDTSSTATCFSLLLISQHQDVQEKIIEEINDVFGDINKPIVYEDLMKLKYLEAVIKEVLRLFPPIPVIIRDSDKEIVLSSDLTVPKRCNALVSVFGLHRDPKNWGDDVEEFKPERFLTGNIPSAYMPFGTGLRRCSGNLYAMLLIKTTLLVTLRRYRLLPAKTFEYNKSTPLRIIYSFVLRHFNNYELRMEHRYPSKAH